MQTVHPLRETLHHEVHARPYERMNAPLLLSHIALVGNAGGAEREEEPGHVVGKRRQHHRVVEDCVGCSWWR